MGYFNLSQPCFLDFSKNVSIFYSTLEKVRFADCWAIRICSNFQLKTWSLLFETFHLTSNFLTIPPKAIFYIFQEVSHPLFGFVAIHHSRSGMSRELLWRGGGWDGDTLNTIEKITKPESRVKQSTKRNLQDIKCSLIKSSSRAGLRCGSPPPLVRQCKHWQWPMTKSVVSV